MENKPLFLIVLFFGLCEIALLQRNTDLQQSECYEGVQKKRGNFWYVCRQGHEVPVSCIAPDGRTQFAIGSTYRHNSFLLECSQPAPNSIQMVPIACVTKDHVINPGSLFTLDNVFYHRCIKTEDTLQSQLAGCVGKFNELVPNGGLVKRNQFIFRCVVRPNGISLEAYACTMNNRQYMVNEEIMTSLVWYKCESDPNSGSISLSAKGCVKENRKYIINQKFDDGNFLHQCFRDDNKIYTMAIGCVEPAPNQTKLEYYPGQQWLATMADHNRYLIECQKRNTWLKRIAVQCYYSTPEGQGYLNGGCGKVIGRVLFECFPATGDNNPNVRLRISEPYDKDRPARPLAAGLQFC